MESSTMVMKHLWNISEWMTQFNLMLRRRSAFLLSAIGLTLLAMLLVILVSFWFDGGLFKLATASLFWILLELGAETRFKPRINTDQHGSSAANEHRDRSDKTTKDTNYTKAIIALSCLRSFIWSSVLAIRVHPCSSVVKVV